MSQIKPAHNICALARSGRYSDRCRAHWRSDIQFGNGAGESDTWSRGPFVSGSQRPSPALREGHINSRGIQLNGSKVLSKYDAAPKTSAYRYMRHRNSGGRDMGGFGNKNAD